MAATQPSVHQLYRRLETIGKGAYGSVHKGEHIPTGNVVALKIINLDDKSGSDDVGDIQREVALLSQLRDAPNVTKYYGCYMDGPRVWIVMEFAQGGSVLSLMKSTRNGCLEEKHVAVIVREVLVGLSYLHKVPVIHRDIKAANILVTATGKVVICDFGVSALLATSFSKRNTLTGTPHWMAPELLQTLPVYDTKADIWSLGISIYEMIKGSPPHNTLENIKVMDLIPKAQPPRLHDSEAGKDLRDFMALCLRESPAERLPADELSKSKWIKSIGKVSVSILKDLVTRFEQAAKRASLADPLDWEEEEERDLLRLNVEDENPWEFETVRGRSFQEPPFEEDEVIGAENDDQSTHSTIRSPQSSTLPLSLRSLFEDDQLESLRPPTFQIPSHPNTPSPPGSAPPSTTSSPGRERVPLKKPLPPDSTGSEFTVKQKGFVHPPRNMVPSRLKRSPNIPESDDENMAGIPSNSISAPTSRISPIPTSDLPSLDSSDDLKRAITRDIRALRLGHILPGKDDLTLGDEKTVVETSLASIVTSGHPSIPDTSSTDSLIITRKRSQSTGEALVSRRNKRADIDLASPRAFQFPASQKPLSSFEYTPSSSLPQRRYGQSSPTRPSTSTSTSPHNTHQATYSLDTSAATRRGPAPSSLLPPSITRTRSATTLPDAYPSLTEVTPISQVSQDNVTSLVPPLKPFAPSTRSRSGSDASYGNVFGTPGLKDVLKIPSLTSEHRLGMSDLLPPSPSTAVYNARTFLASPSSLSSSTSMIPVDTQPLHMFPRDAAPSGISPLVVPRAPSPPLLRRTVTEPTFTTSMSEHVTTHARKVSLGTTPPPAPQTGPTLRPLDYNKLITDENTYSELARTINDLTQWLTVVEAGLNGMLDKVYADTIEEEQEVSSDLEDAQ